MNLTAYINKTVGKRNRLAGVVNCYDQAAAVCTFATLFGIDVQYKFMEPFGYINTTDLVGLDYDNCNNPFFRNNLANKLVAPDLPTRSGFKNHAFAVFRGYVFDACAGPALGTQTEAQYVADVIDVSLPKLQGKAGSVSDIELEAVTSLK